MKSPPPELPHPTPQDTKPAQILAIELETRIATQPLHYRSGDEETAAASLHKVFLKTRDLLSEHLNAPAFQTAALFFLNHILRPNTARWHRWMVDHKFTDERSRRQFRYELQRLQPHLKEFLKTVNLIAEEEGDAVQEFARLAEKFPSVDDRPAQLGGEILAGFATEVGVKSGELHESLVIESSEDKASMDKRSKVATFLDASDIDRFERRSINRRRQKLEKEREDELKKEKATNETSRGNCPAGEATAGSPLQVPPRPSPPIDLPAEEAAAAESPVVNASGLCLSGGGIRSATFCLGIVQALVRRNLFAQFDYLSTVSGGGYLGTFLTSYLGARRDPDQGVQAIIREAFRATGGSESPALRHLRNNSRYLISGGLWARFKILGLLLTGIITNIFLMLPLPLVAVLVVWALWNLDYWQQGGWRTPAFTVFARLGIVFAGGWFLLPVVRNIARGAPHGSLKAGLRNFWEATCVILGILVLFFGCLLAIPTGFEIATAIRKSHPWEGASALARQVVNSEKLLGLIIILAPVIFGLFAFKSKPGTRSKKWMTIFFALSGPLLLFVVFLIVGNRAVGPEQPPVWCIGWVALVTFALAAWAWLFVDLNEFSPHRYYRNRLCECYLAAPGVSQRGQVSHLIRRLLHGREKNETLRQSGVGVLRQLPLSKINESGAAPYHLINCAANLPASMEPNLRGRDCDFFTFSRHYCGGPVCGYVSTNILEKLDSNMDLGTAMAVSGAAASSNMGVKTLRHFRFLMTMLNIRLGYWLRNPIAGLRSAGNAPGPFYLLREMMGWMHEKTDYLNLSDGGHIENLALYEMLRRRCKYIVVVDGAMEPGMEGADLMLAQRYAEIDLGVRFEIDLADLALDASRRSRAYAVFGKIHYSARPNGADADDLGWLIYFHLARTGGEPGYVLDYARQNPEFPHQTTGDQIYDEAQFEAYRRLGECAAESLFRPEISKPDKPVRPDIAASEDELPFKTLEGWFQALANSLLFDNDPAFESKDAGVAKVASSTL